MWMEWEIRLIKAPCSGHKKLNSKRPWHAGRRAPRIGAAAEGAATMPARIT